MEQKQLTLSVHKLHIYRRKWRGDVFGSSDDDDVDVLFYLYARHLAEKQEGQGEGMGHFTHAISIVAHCIELVAEIENCTHTHTHTHTHAHTPTYKISLLHVCTNVCSYTHTNARHSCVI